MPVSKVYFVLFTSCGPWYRTENWCWRTALKLEDEENNIMNTFIVHQELSGLSK